MTGLRIFGKNSSWTDEHVRRLRELWPTGLSTALIGRELGVSKGAVVGKARRIGLPKRKTTIPISTPKRGGKYA